MVNLTNLPRTTQPTICVVPSFDATYLDVLLKGTKELYSVYYYTDILRGFAPFTLKEALKEIDVMADKTTPCIPLILETPFEAEALRQALKPLFNEPFDDDFLAWQKQFITPQIYTTPNVQPFKPVSLEKNVISDDTLTSLFFHMKGMSS